MMKRDYIMAARKPKKSVEQQHLDYIRARDNANSVTSIIFWGLLLIGSIISYFVF